MIKIHKNRLGLVGGSAPHTPGPGTQVPAEWDGRLVEWDGRNGTAGTGRPEWDGRNGTAGMGRPGEGYPEGPRKNKNTKKNGFMCPERPGLSEIVQKA